MLPLVSIEAVWLAAIGAMEAETSCVLPVAYCNMPPVKLIAPVVGSMLAPNSTCRQPGMSRRGLPLRRASSRRCP